MKPDHSFIQTLVQYHQQFYCIPRKQQAEAFVDELFQFLFLPQGKSSELVLEQKHQHLQLALTTLLVDATLDGDKASAVVADFCAAIPDIYNQLIQDAEAILASDPAACSLGEVIIAYPGFYTTFVYRLAHQLW